MRYLKYNSDIPKIYRDLIATAGNYRDLTGEQALVYFTENWRQKNVAWRVRDAAKERKRHVRGNEPNAAM